MMYLSEEEISRHVFWGEPCLSENTLNDRYGLNQ